MSRESGENPAQLFQSGLREFREGRTAQAQALCERVLRVAPKHPEALLLLGAIALQRADHAAAVDVLSRAVAVRPANSAAHANLAYGYVGLGRYQEALAAFERAAKLDPADPDLRLAIGNCLALLGRLKEAEAVFRRLAERDARNVVALFNLGNAVKDQGRHEEARDLYSRVLKLSPESAEAHCNLGVVLHKLDRPAEAERAFRSSLARNPGFIPAHVGLAITLNFQGRHQEAESQCREALARDPAYSGAWPVLGRALACQFRWAETLECFEQAARQHPADSDIRGALAAALVATGRMERALEAFESARSLENASAQTHLAHAFALLSMGRMTEGAAAFAGRHLNSRFVEGHPEQPLSGNLPHELGGAALCVHREWGLGDEIFFLRFAPWLKTCGCRIFYHGSVKILPLLARCRALDRVAAAGEPFSGADHVLLAGDLLSCYFLRAGSLEAPPPLPLEALPDRLTSARERLARLGPPPYVGVTWRAGTGPTEQRGYLQELFKEIPLDRLGSCLRGTGATLVSLQRNPRPGEAEALAAHAGRPVHDLSAANEDLEDMLALLAVIDDYVGVSNTNMHLRAGCGRTAKVLVPWPAEWRWMIAGDESPWFPGFRIYRQAPDGDWDEGLGRLAADLRAA
jgi:tetratricopeptide (TPR) repeat protein